MGENTKEWSELKREELRFKKKKKREREQLFKDKIQIQV